jgi:hypothetical protein
MMKIKLVRLVELQTQGIRKSHSAAPLPLDPSDILSISGS